MGIILLILLLCACLGSVFWQRNQQGTQAIQLTKNAYQTWIDSAKTSRYHKKYTYKIYPFNPNFISDYKGYKLGMSTAEIDRLQAYRQADKWVNSVEDFQQVTKVSDSLLSVISPYFKFPEWVVERQKRLQKQKHQPQVAVAEKIDLNRATVTQLVAVKGIGKVLANRIVHYRNKLGYFVDNSQLKDIYGLTYERRDELLNYFTVKSHMTVKKINLNTALVEDLMEVPYFDYELARNIRNYRLTHEGILNFDELTKIENFPIGKLERVKLYVSLKDE